MVLFRIPPSEPGTVIVKGDSASADRLAADFADGQPLERDAPNSSITPTFWGIDVEAMPALESQAHVAQQANARAEVTFVTFSPGAKGVSIRRALVGDGMWPPGWSMAVFDPTMSAAAVRDLLLDKWDFQKGARVVRQ